MAVAHASLSSDLGARRHERPMEDDRVAAPNCCTSRRCGFDSPNLGNRETRWPSVTTRPSCGADRPWVSLVQSLPDELAGEPRRRPDLVVLDFRHPRPSSCDKTALVTTGPYQL